MTCASSSVRWPPAVPSVLLGPVQTIIWQVESFGFHMVEMEFRQHSVVHARALKDIHENGIHGDLQPMTREVIDTFHAIGSIQSATARRWRTATSSRLPRVPSMWPTSLSLPTCPSHRRTCPELDVIPLFRAARGPRGLR